MKTIKTTTLALAAALGALSMTAAPASAKGFHGGGFHGGGFHGGGFKGGFHGKHFGHHGHWGHRHYGWGYGVGVAYLAADCYWVRTYRGLVKICE